MNQLDSEDILNSLVGHRFIEWGKGDGGYHFTLDDGRTVIMVGYMAILQPDENVLH